MVDFSKRVGARREKRKKIKKSGRGGKALPFYNFSR
jgi:hypothetical protein